MSLVTDDSMFDVWEGELEGDEEIPDESEDEKDEDSIAASMESELKAKEAAQAKDMQYAVGDVR